MSQVGTAHTNTGAAARGGSFAYSGAQQKDSSAALSVSQAVGLAKGTLETLTVRLVGEVSEVKVKAGYKAAYFTVKDAGSSLSCMMWLNRYRACEVELKVGMMVELRGRFTVYAARGTMNFDVFSMSLVGDGYLREQVAKLAEKLRREGLMDPARKRAIPQFPEHIGIVTSSRGDAVYDFLRTLRERYPLARVSVAGVLVEGVTAPAEMIAGLRACANAGCELVLLGRGGGSYESLMPFNDENLARAIAAMPVPVITGIGHEPDTTIADMVADKRAATPTFAVMAASPDSPQVSLMLMKRASAMSTSMSLLIQRESARLDARANRPALSDPYSMFMADSLTLDLLQDKLARSLPARLEQGALRLETYQTRLARALPAAMQQDTVHLAALQERMNRAAAFCMERNGRRVQSAHERLMQRQPRALEAFEHAFALRAGRLHDLSPLAVLSRGYAVAQDASGHVVKSVASAPAGSNINVALADGTLHCTVNSSTPTQSLKGVSQ